MDLQYQNYYERRLETFNLFMNLYMNKLNNVFGNKAKDVYPLTMISYVIRDISRITGEHIKILETEFEEPVSWCEYPEYRGFCVAIDKDCVFHDSITDNSVVYICIDEHPNSNTSIIKIKDLSSDDTFEYCDSEIKFLVNTYIHLEQFK